MAPAVTTLWLVTRKHPPSVGGMQQLSWNIVREVSGRTPTTVLKWGGGNAGLVFFLPWAALRLWLGLLAGRIRALHLGDPVLACLAGMARRRGVPVAVTVHGLDITWPNRIYQKYLSRFFWGRMDAYVCISSHVQSLVEAHGVPGPLIHLIPVGAPPAIEGDPARLPAALAGADPLLCSVGRLVERKGIAWFVDQVLPTWLAQHPHAIFAIAGEGPERAAINTLVARHGLGNQVKLLGGVDEPTKWALLSAADLVLMPNIAVEGDIEGFGLAALEAGSAGSFVLAADREGLRDAVIEGGNGRRLPTRDAGAWIAGLDSLLSDRPRLRELGEQGRQIVAREYGWPAIGQRYISVLETMSPPTRASGARLRRLGWALGVVALGLVCWQVWQHREQVDLAWRQLDPVRLAAALALGLGAQLLFALAWYRLIHAAAPTLALRSHLARWLLTLGGKYVPGKIWQGVGRVALYQGEIGAGAVAATYLREMLLSTSAACAVASLHGLLFGSILGLLAPGLAALSLALALLAQPRFAAAFMAWLPPRLRPAASTDRPIPAASLGLAWLLQLSAYLTLGLALALIADGVLPMDGERFAVVASGLCLAGIAGIAAFFVPAGLGVREAMLTWYLAQYMNVGEAGMIALLARGWLTLAEACAIGLGVALGPRRSAT